MTTRGSAVGAHTRQARDVLVDLLHEAAELEHCLLDAYLYAACSLKSTPQELEVVGGLPNRRRAVQFERLRAWKQSILNVAHEEMLHLHYVECMLRALGEAPSFALPGRDPDNGNWLLPGWRARIGSEPVDGDRGVQVPVSPFTLDIARRFVLYESSDSLQNRDPFGDKATALFERLHDFELDVHFEGALLQVEDAPARERLKQRLTDLYTTLTPVPPEAAPEVEALVAPEPLPPVEDLKFQSIADLYNRGILPLYEEAFDMGWVTNSNLNLNDELLNPEYAAEGFLPIGPVYRDKNFESFARKNIDDPLRNYRRVQDIVKEIVEEGEGLAQFEARAERLLAKVANLGGAGAYLRALLDDARSPNPTPRWLADGELLRKSHLYRFAMTLSELRQEQDLARQSGMEFEAGRQPLDVGLSVELTQLGETLPAQFNACYLVLLAWLARIYEVRDWQADMPRRLAIEMLASWPLMSLAVRPFLELASFFPNSPSRLFRVYSGGLPLLPLHAQELQRLYAAPERSEEINMAMDYLAMHTLSDVAAWAKAQHAVVHDADLPDHHRTMILDRLSQLAQLDEFEKQFPYRVAGGYSSRMPDLTYRRSHPRASDYEEDPSGLAAVFQETFVLRLRFAGWGLVQLATDPDPPLDEVGCTGTHMLHAADGDRRLNRALVWQLTDPENTILREPRAALPPLGVEGVEASLLVTAGSATAGYVPLQVMQSTGAVQTSGVQQVLQVDGLNELMTLPAREVVLDDGRLLVELLDKGGQKPFLNGVNHLVWQDGEPIDPFILAVLAEKRAGTGAPQLLLRREVYNGGHDLLEMSPLQRLLSARQPCGFDGNLANIPEWARARLTPDARRFLGRPRAYLAARATALVEVLDEALGAADGDPEAVVDQGAVDRVVSLAERLSLVSVPRGTTVGWLRILLNYGHTVSGALKAADGDDPLLAAFAQRTGLTLAPTTGLKRDDPNGRWLVAYTKGIMDTDALSDFVFGELYVPVTVETPLEPVHLRLAWQFTEAVHDAVAGYACRFDRPFWAQYHIDGDVRTQRLPDGGTMVETLTPPASPTEYHYTATGLPGITAYEGSFQLSRPADPGGDITLSWNVDLSADSAAGMVSAASGVASAAEAMTTAMEAHFGPRRIPPT